MRNRDFYPGHHGGLLFSFSVFFPGPAILGDHADELFVAGHDGRDGGEEAGAEHEVAETGDVEEGGGGGEAGGEEVGLDVGCCEGVEDVEAPCEHVEGDGEVDYGWVEGKSIRSVSNVALFFVCVLDLAF